ncbi:HAD-IC family P-type ATPase [Actinomadura sp. DC4]|uniref:HAD-IC family P-type ATPase n=1 Tax=Actinomadura sp. DC4 TaxID=3055069 RepID=UPI0025B028C9|nr:HAD-IC family P-type ATPase [Actinomadura sp. DC4]MDN3359769.1 HAD-IC family P-type ATPase [Actinomadura sp. DC4]
MTTTMRPAIDVHDQGVWELSARDALTASDVDAETGLSAAEAATRLERWGPNALPPARTHGPLVRFLLQFHSPLIYVLLVSALAAALIGERVDAAVIVTVLIVNALVGFVQESHAEGALAALAAMTETTSTVLRDGTRRPVPSAAVVPGDLIILDAGDKVPADLRIVESHELRTDESALTGESAPVAKHVRAVRAGTPLADRRNMAHSGTLVTSGSGVGVATATGTRTEIGLIHGLMRRTSSRQTPLTRKIATFSRFVTVAVLVLGAATFAIGIARGQSAAEMLAAAIALAVGAIPEGLPAMVTVALAFGVARLVRRKVVVRRLPVVETLGSTTVICTDKTGTLTENKMTVVALVAGGETHDLPGPEDDEAVRECLIAGLACNDARLLPGEEISGDPTEAALLVSAARAGLTEAPSRLATVPFSSERRFMATLHPGVVYVKGSVERVLDLCTRQLDRDGRAQTLDRPGALAAAERLGHDGLRVLAFARAEVSPEILTLAEADLPPLVFLGLQGMYDPPRAASAPAVRACRDAGVQVKMITGDHAATAQAVAERIGLDGPVMTGTDLERCADDRLPEAAERTTIFARVSPEQKLRLVRALQSRGHVIAMTGDGVNDAPALKRADIGVAMGRGGTEVAKESADMVLTDDDFASIAAAVEEGRGVFDNLTRFIVWALPANLGLGLVLIAAIAAGTTLPLLPIQVLWLNMTAVLVLGLPFTLEPTSPELMRRPPRDPSRPLLTADLAGRVLLVSGILLAGAFGLFHWDLAHGASVAEARTVVVNVFALTLTTYLFNCLSLERPLLWAGVRRNPSIVAAVLALAALQALYTYLPFSHHVFGSASLHPAAWLRVTVVAVVSYVVIEAVKALHAALTHQR